MPLSLRIFPFFSASLLAAAACNQPSGESTSSTKQRDTDCPVSTYASVPMRGVNLSGAEWGSNYPGQEGVDYVWPTAAEVDYFLGKGMNTFRVGFEWERLQPAAGGDLAPDYFARLDALVTYALQRGARVVIHPHNFARYYDQVVGSDAVPNEVFADLWRRLAEVYREAPGVLFNLDNEPHDMPTEEWVSAANAAIAAIRDAGANNTVVVPGNAWTGAASWSSNWYGTPNAVAMLAISDPAERVLFEVHQYLDDDMSGGSGTCVSPTAGSERLAGFVGWLRDHGKKGFLGEFAGGANPTCDAALKDMLAFVAASGDVLEGWAWWSGGPGWSDDYIFRLEPDANGNEGAEWSALAPNLADRGACASGGGGAPPGGGGGAPGGGSYTASSQTLISSGVTRSFILAAPSPAAAAPLPLVLVLHSDGQSADDMRQNGPALEAQAAGAAVFAYLESPDGDAFPYWTAEGRGAEATFVKDIIASLAGQGLVRDDRVFIAGTSGGGTMTNAIACVLGSSVLRGAAVMSGSFYAIDGQDLWATLPDGTEVRACAPDVAVQIQWGQDDTGDTDFTAAGEVTRDMHRAALGCGDATAPLDPAPCVSYAGCAQPVSWCAIPNMGHAVWSNAGIAAWRFFASVP